MCSFAYSSSALFLKKKCIIEHVKPKTINANKQKHVYNIQVNEAYLFSSYYNGRFSLADN